MLKISPGLTNASAARTDSDSVMPPAQREIRSEFEMRQEADGYQVTLEMPGLRSEDLDVSIADGMLRFKGETKTDMRHVTIDRAARLPSMADTESDKVKVYHADGLITVFLPNLPEPERRVPERLPERRELNIELLPQPPSVMLPEDEATGSKGTDTEDEANGYTFTFAVPGLNTDDLTIAFEGVPTMSAAPHILVDDSRAVAML